MLIVLFAITLLIVASIKINHGGVDQALSIPQTQTIKGAFVISIFLSHFCSYVMFVEWFDKPLMEYCHWLGQLVVAPFLFYSGYGVFESVKRKGFPYVASFPKKRILKVLVHFDFAVMLFLIYDVFFAPEFLSWQRILLSLVAWLSVGNSTWFIFAIICVYIFSYCAFVIFKEDRRKSLCFILFFCLLYIFAVSRFKDGYWFDTILAFPFGCLTSLCKAKFTIGGGKWFLSAVFYLLLLLVAKSGLIPSSFVNTQFALVGFMLLIVFLSMKIMFKNKILSWFGTYVFEIYILQRLPMNFGKFMHWNEQNIYLYFLFCFVVTLLLAVGFKEITKRIDKILFKG